MPRTPRQIKKIEAETNHDVKAIEYWLKERVAWAGTREVAGGRWSSSTSPATSEDINNTVATR